VTDTASTEIEERTISQAERDKIPAQDFAGKNRSFPIATPADVAAAAASIGRAGSDNYSTDELKRRIIAIAKRKGPTFVAQLPETWKGSSEAAAAVELTGDCIALTETGAADDDTFPVKIIQEGWGTSGYYGREMLARCAPAAFPPGTHMYWNHPTKHEAQERMGLRDLRDLAAVLIERPAWREDGFAGAGVYSRFKPFGGFTQTVREMAPFIGVSIRAMGQGVESEVDGRKGILVTGLEADTDGLHSVDFVPRAGAGGKYLAMFESAHGGATSSQQEKETDLMDEPNVKLQEALAQVVALQTRIDEATAKITELTEAKATADSELKILREVAVLGQAKAVVEKALASSKLPSLTRDRLAATLVADPPVKDGGLDETALTASIEEAVQAASAEVAAIIGTGVVGMGSSRAETSPLKDAFRRRFAREGKSPEEAEKLAQFAINGR
jgi:hypothetical protein